MAMKISGAQRGAPAMQAAAEPAPSEPRTRAGRQAEEDKLELSPEALAALKNGGAQAGIISEPLSPAEKKLQDKLSSIRSMKQMLDSVRQQSAQMAEQSDKQAKAMKESLDKMKRCAKIAKNIQKGHKVPPKDEKYLLENDPKLYMMAMALRMLEDPDNKRVKSELKKEEEERQNEAAPGVEGVDMAAGADIPVEIDAQVNVE